MQLQTQHALEKLNTYSRDKGLTSKELSVLDKDGDKQLSKVEVSGSGINIKDLAEINQRWKTQQIMSNLPFLEDMPIFSHAELNTELFPEGVRGISAADIDQGGLGDCYYLAAIAGLAHQRPQDIVNMITDNKNGTYTVKLPGASKAVTVKKPTSNELAQYAHRGENGSTWVNVLEKAYAVYTNNNAWFSSSNPRDMIDDGGLNSTGIHMITGNSTDTDTLSLTRNSTTRSKLKKAMANDKVVTLSSFWDGDDSKHIPDNHVYTVLSYNSANDTVRVRNPWGSGNDATDLKYNDGNDDGVFTLTLAEMDEYFSFICYEN